MKLDDFPWFQFQEIFDAIRLVGLPNDQHQGLVESRGTNPQFCLTTRKTDDAIVGFSSDLLVASNLSRNFWSSSPSSGIPNFGLDRDIDIGDSLFDLPTKQTSLLPATEMPAPVLSSIFGGVLQSDKSTAITLLWPDLINGVLPILQGKMLERHDGELMEDFQRLLQPCTPDATLCIIKYALYFLSNNMLDNDQVDGFLAWMVSNDHQTMWILKSLLSEKLLTIQASLSVLFRRAVQTGNVRFTEALLTTDVNLSQAFESSGIRLREVIATGNIELVRLLLQAGVDIKKYAQDTMDDTDLIYPGTLLQAAKTAEMAQLLLDGGADVNALGYHSPRRQIKSSVQSAVDYDNIELVRTMLKAGANVNAAACDPWGRTALMRAVEKRRYGIVEELLRAGAQVDIYGHYIYGDPKSGYRDLTELQLAASLGEYHIAELLLAAGADVNKPAFGEHGSTALQGPAKRGNRKILALLLAAGANPNLPHNTRVKFPRSALLEAVENDKIGLVKDLLGAGVDANAPAFGDYGSNPLEAALAVKSDNGGNDNESIDGDDSSDGGISVVDMLVKAGADITPSVNNSHRGFELRKAVERADIKRVQFLLDMGVGVEKELRVAITKGNAELVGLLLKEGADVNVLRSETSEGTALQETILKGDIELTKRLLKAGANVNAPGTWKNGTALEIAIKKENATAVQLLLQAGAEVNIPRARNPLQLAAALQDKEVACQVIQFLLAKRAFVNVPADYHSGRTALQVAVENAKTVSDLQVVWLLLEAGEDINAPAGLERGMTALQLAVAGGSLKIVQALLKVGADINAPAGQIFGRTALQVAVEEAEKTSSFKIIDFLLDNKADVNGQPGYEQGRTALQIAATAKKGNINLIQHLLTAGANINASVGISSGVTALQGAAIQGHTKIVLKLLEAGADVNAAGSKRRGRTALEGASERGRLDIVKILLNAGADSHLPERRRYIRAAELAKDNKHFAISTLLEASRGL
jgi:ankyrin repeat protein